MLNAKGESVSSYADYAVAMVDEAVSGEFFAVSCRPIFRERFVFGGILIKYLKNEVRNGIVWKSPKMKLDKKD